VGCNSRRVDHGAHAPVGVVGRRIQARQVAEHGALAVRVVGVRDPRAVLGQKQGRGTETGTRLVGDGNRWDGNRDAGRKQGRDGNRDAIRCALGDDTRG
jgi:hypothetical protein